MTDRKKEEFLARLRETFRVEAAEHIQAIASDLLALEKCAPGDSGPLVEHVFREAHSLKGAARSVGLAAAETLCLELENLFACMKRGELQPSTELLDSVHPALSVLTSMCDAPGAARTPQESERERAAVASLQQLTRGTDAPRQEPSPPQNPIAPPSPPPTESIRPKSTSVPTTGDTVRVSTQKLVALLLETEELVGARIAATGRSTELRHLAGSLADWNQRRLRLASRLRSGYANPMTANEFLESEVLFTRGLENSLRKLASAAQQDAFTLSGIGERLQEDTKKLLLLPCSYLLGSLPQVVRDLAREQGKEATLEVVGEDIEIDRRVLDELKAPLLHLLRNSIDHGIETPEVRRQLGKPRLATITVSTRSVGNSRVEFSVADDGAGIQTERVRAAAVRMGLLADDRTAPLPEAELTELVFRSGLTTSPMLTDLSGRGLGLAIVQERVERLGGSIDVQSTPGVGTRFRMVVPLSMATFRGVFVDACARRFVIPTASVVRVARVRADQIQSVENRQTVQLGGRALSLVRLRDVLELSGPEPTEQAANRLLVVVRSGERQIALVVDEVIGEQEVMLKSLGRQLPKVQNLAGATITNTGVVVPILNVAELMDSACAEGIGSGATGIPENAGGRVVRLLIAEDSITARTLVKNILEGAGYEVVATVDGMDALTRLKTEDFDLVVSDVDMPRLNGFELTAKIRADKRLGALPVVLVTALGSQKDREYGIEVGANAYIVKSDFEQGNLLEIIRRLV